MLKRLPVLHWTTLATVLCTMYYSRTILLLNEVNGENLLLTEPENNKENDKFSLILLDLFFFLSYFFFKNNVFWNNEHVFKRSNYL